MVSGLVFGAATFTVDRTPAIYGLGETATATLKEDGQADRSFDHAQSVCGLYRFSAKLADNQTSMKIGVMYAPETIATARPEPTDFDGYWAAELAKMEADTPIATAAAAATVTLYSSSSTRSIYDVSIPTMAGKKPVRGYLTVPANAQTGKHAIIYRLCGAGTYSAPIEYVSGAVLFAINPHGIDNGLTEAEYATMKATPVAEGGLKDYNKYGWQSRDTCYFHDQILRLVRGLQWLKTRPEWNGRDIIVRGASMGGSQTIQIAALDHDVTVCAPVDPALCDHAGHLDTPARTPGWPSVRDITDVDPDVLMTTADYYNNVFFARRIRSEVYFATGFCDTTCNSEGVYLAYNSTTNAKSRVMTTNPTAGHCGTANTPALAREAAIVEAASRDIVTHHETDASGFEEDWVQWTRTDGRYIITIPAGKKLRIGGTGASDPRKINNHGNQIFFEPGSTLYVTNWNDTLSIWAGLFATNGQAYVNVVQSPVVNSHLVSFGTGALQFEGQPGGKIRCGHSGNVPVYDLANVTIRANGAARGTTNLSAKISLDACFLRSRPTSHALTPNSASSIWYLCGEKDVAPDSSSWTVACTNVLLGSAALAGKTVTVSSYPLLVAPLDVPLYDDIPANYTMQISGRTARTTTTFDDLTVNLSGTGSLQFADPNPYGTAVSSGEIIWNGTVCGAGDIVCNASGTVRLGGAASDVTGTLVVGQSGNPPVITSAMALQNMTVTQSAGLTPVFDGSLTEIRIGRWLGTNDINATLTVPDGQTVRFSATEGPMALAGAGTFVLPTVSGEPDSFTNHVSCWFDFSRTDCMRRVSQGSSIEKAEWTSSTDGNGLPLVERWMDWRRPGDVEGYTLWNRRLYLGSASQLVNSVYPALKVNGYPHDSTKSYLTMQPTTGNATRIPFALGTCDAASTQSFNLPIKAAFVVFGSANGGGTAVLGTTDGLLGRTNSKTSPFLTTAAAGLTFRTNGVAITPTEVNPNGDWQIITLETTDEIKFASLGWNTYNTSSRGSDYGELLICTNAIDEASRLEAECYLAKKWNLTYPTTAAEARIAELRAAVRFATTNELIVSGAATVVAKGPRVVRLSGIFTGRVDLDAGKLELAGGRVPYTESEVAAVQPDDRYYWADPDDAETVIRLMDVPTGETDLDRISVIKDKVRRSYSSTEFVCTGAGRMPRAVRGARASGPERTWIDYRHGTYSNTGNVLRFAQLPTLGGTSIGSTASDVKIQTAFFVQDMAPANGRGSLLLDVNGATGKINARSNNGEMWPGSATAYRSGENRLNGVTVAQADGFSLLPEVFTTRPTGNTLNTPYIGNYNDTNGSANNNGIVLGEFILYTAPLSDEDVIGIEGYLMQKWLGILPSGFGDQHASTVTGSGDLTVPKLSQLPCVAADFAGTVTVGGDTGEVTMTVDAQTHAVAGAIVNAGATFTFPKTATIRVKFAETPGKRSSFTYPLVAAAGAANTDWTVDLSDSSVPRNIATVVRDGDTVALVIRKPGFVIHLR